MLNRPTDIAINRALMPNIKAKKAPKIAQSPNMEG
jgi:hypothetical protein